MRLLKSYIIERLKWFTCWLVSVVVIGITYVVFNLPIEAINYIIVLNTFFYVVFMAFDFYRYIEKRSRLKHVLDAVSNRSNFIETTRDSLEGDYIDMVNILIDEKNRLITSTDISKTELLDYYSMWVHQIKTPIAALDLMVQTSTDANKQSMSVELFKIEQYVNMALNFIRLDSESSDFVFVPVDLELCVKQVVKKYRKIFIENKIGLSLQIEPNTQITTDEKWLMFALEQIISNALKYSTEGEITISYGNGQLIVEDTGCGIQPEDLPRVFDKGFTGYNGRMHTKATGIGLYLTKRVLQKLSLSIDIQSTVGVGTRVIILTSM